MTLSIALRLFLVLTAGTLCTAQFARADEAPARTTLASATRPATLQDATDAPTRCERQAWPYRIACDAPETEAPRRPVRIIDLSRP